MAEKPQEQDRPRLRPAVSEGVHAVERVCKYATRRPWTEKRQGVPERWVLAMRALSLTDDVGRNKHGSSVWFSGVMNLPSMHFNKMNIIVKKECLDPPLSIRLPLLLTSALSRTQTDYAWHQSREAPTSATQNKCGATGFTSSHNGPLLPPKVMLPKNTDDTERTDILWRAATIVASGASTLVRCQNIPAGGP